MLPSGRRSFKINKIGSLKTPYFEEKSSSRKGDLQIRVLNFHGIKNHQNVFFIKYDICIQYYCGCNAVLFYFILFFILLLFSFSFKHVKNQSNERRRRNKEPDLSQTKLVLVLVLSSRSWSSLFNGYSHNFVPFPLFI